MGKECKDYVEQFDAFFSTKQLKLLKLLLPYLAPPLRKKMIVYIKYREWQITMQYLNRPRLFHEQQELTDNPFLTEDTPSLNLEELLPMLEPYLSPEEQANLKQFKGLQENMEMMRQMQDIMQTCGGMEQDLGSMETLFQMFQQDSDGPKE